MEDTWRTLFNEHTRAPIYTVSHYVSYLRRFVADTTPTGSGKGSGTDKKADKRRRGAATGRKNSTTDSIDPLSYFLRKLKLDLKVSYDSFVQDFVRPENQGLTLLLRLLSNIQSSSSSGAPRSSSSSSSSSLNVSSTPLEEYKKAVTDEYDCLLCIKFCLRIPSAANQLVENTDGLQRMAAGVQGSSSKARITCLEILTVCITLDKRAVEGVVEAFTVLRLQTGQSVRFKMLVSMLHTKSPSQVLFQVTCLKLFNTLLNNCASGNQRVYLQHELLTSGLDLEFLSKCADGDGLEYDDLRREIGEWKTRFIDVDALLKKLRESYREPVGGRFSSIDGPVQTSSRVDSLRGGHGPNYFQHEQQSDVDYKRGFMMPTSHRINNGTLDHYWQRKHVSGPEADDSDSDFVSVSAQQTPNFRRKFLAREPSWQTHTKPLHHNLFRSEQHLHHNPKPNSRPQNSNELSNGVVHEHGARESTSLYRQNSVESFVDAYGLVIHSRDIRGDKPNQDTYSNFKLRYFSSPSIHQTRENNHENGNSKIDDPETVLTNGSFKTGNGDTRESRDMTWNGVYPFSKRALYHNLDKAAERTSTAVPQRVINPSLSTDSQSKQDQPVQTPIPDYTPIVTPRGSVRSLNAEVARVLLDFENTLRAHEPSRPSSVAEVGPVAFV